MSSLFNAIMSHRKMRVLSYVGLALAMISLFAHSGLSQNHQDLQVSIASGNEALSEAVFGLHTTAYYQSGSLQIAGDGAALSLDFLSANFSEVNFTNDALNSVSTVIIRFENADQVAAAIDGAALGSLENLAQVVLLFTFDVDASQASTFALSNLPPGVTSYYSISIAE